MPDDTDAFGNRPGGTPPPYPTGGAPTPPPTPEAVPAASPTPSAQPQPAAGAAPAGWYPDPGGSGQQRWWDGRQWYPVHGAPQHMGTQGGGTDGFAIAALVLSVLGGILLSVIFAIVALNRIKSGKRTDGRGMAIAALWISGAWALLIAGFIVLAITGALDDNNVDKYHGEQRKIARVIDEFEENADDSPSATCALMTERLQNLLAASSGTCEAAFEHEDGVQANLDAKSITLIDANRALARVDEDGDELKMDFVRENGVWKIELISDAP